MWEKATVNITINKYELYKIKEYKISKYLFIYMQEAK